MNGEKSIKRSTKRTPIFLEVHKIKNSLCPLRTFLQALEDPVNWQVLIPQYLKDCSGIVEKIDEAADSIIELEGRSIEKTILFVDDNYLFGSMVKALLTAKGFKVLFATDLAHAKQLIANDTPGIVVLDYALAEGTTVDFAISLRTQLPAAYIIIATGEVEQLHHIQALLHKDIANAFMKKPYGANDLTVLISGLENSGPDQGCPELPPQSEKRT
jgi:CheY-like chemotaxis protein